VVGGLDVEGEAEIKVLLLVGPYPGPFPTDAVVVVGGMVDETTPEKGPLCGWEGLGGIYLRCWR
jgi:hypothetical protein